MCQLIISVFLECEYLDVGNNDFIDKNQNKKVK